MLERKWFINIVYQILIISCKKNKNCPYAKHKQVQHISSLRGKFMLTDINKDIHASVK